MEMNLETNKKEYVVFFEKELLNPTKEVIKQTKLNIEIKQEYFLTGINGNKEYIVGYLVVEKDLDREMLGIEELLRRLPFICIREKNSNYIFANNRNESRLRRLIEKTFCEFNKERDFIYNLFTPLERLRNLEENCVSFMDYNPRDGALLVNNKQGELSTKEIFSEEIEFEVTDTTYGVSFFLDNTILDDLSNFILCFLT